jgi:murein L,D-transpeptidase YafK
MRFVSALLVFALAFGLAACSRGPVPTYTGPEVTQIYVFKESRHLYLMHGDETLRSYEFELGFAPVGHKAQEGDGRTPEGAYLINRLNPNSTYHLSLGISYPNSRDRAKAAAMGVEPGGDIYIHGTPDRAIGRDDWTAGCIAVTDAEIEEIYSMVRVGTPIYIYP